MTSATPPTTPPAPTYVPAAPPRRRPLGVTLLAILDILVGILLLIAAVGILALAGYLQAVSVPSEIQQSIPQWILSAAPMALAFAGIVVLAIGFIAFLMAWAFLKGRNWARVLAIVLLFISILGSLFNVIVTAVYTTDSFFGLLLSIIVPVLLIWYLSTRKVKAWFMPGYYSTRPYP